MKLFGKASEKEWDGSKMNDFMAGRACASEVAASLMSDGVGSSHGTIPSE